jgi:hypothetical protein
LKTSCLSSILRFQEVAGGGFLIENLRLSQSMAAAKTSEKAVCVSESSGD